MDEARGAARAAWNRLNAHERKHRCNNTCVVNAALGDAWYGLKLTSASFEWLLGRTTELPIALHDYYHPEQKGHPHGQR